MDVIKSESDLEDGEIREDVLEDVSDCSLPDITQEDFSHDIDLDSLRNEALKSLQIDEPSNEEEKCRLEALKSLLENTGFMNMSEETLQDIEDLTEEEKLRVEAVKSLMRNINFLTTEETSTSVAIDAKKRKRQRRTRKPASAHKRAKIKEEPVEETKPDKTYLKETTLLLSELSKDVKKISESIENNKVVKNTETNLVNKITSAGNDSVDEFPTVINSVRSWYPKTEFTMTDVPSKKNVLIEHDNFNGGREVKNQSNVPDSQKPENKSTTNSSQKTEVMPECLKSINTVISKKPDRLPKKKPCDEVTEPVKIEPRTTPEQPTKSKTTENTENEPVYNQTIRPKRDFQAKTKLKKTTHQIINSRVIINSQKSKPIPTKINVACSFRKFNSPQPVLPNNKTSYSMTRKSNRYKLNNVPASKYTLKRTNLKIDKTKFVPNKPTSSRYSINRTNRYSLTNLKKFIIPLDDDDRDDSSGSKEDVPAKPAMPLKLSEPQVEPPSSVKDCALEQSPVPVEIKEEPREVPEEVLNDDFASIESPSTTTADTSTFVKEEPMLDENIQPFNVANIEIREVSSLKCDTSPIVPPQDLQPIRKEEPENKSEVSLLFEAEENLVEIRSKLLSSLGELDTSIKTNAQEKEKLLVMIKKLSALKALVIKFEDNIKTQKMKLTMSNSFTQSLYEGVTLRSKTCEKMRDLCTMAGKRIIGTSYSPPEDFVVELEEKQKTLDFSKYVQKAIEKKT